MPLSLLALVPMAFAGCSVESREPRPRTGAEVGSLDLIVPMLESSAASWNAGDLSGFLDDYAVDPALTFVGSSGLLRGRDAVRDSYEGGYWASGEATDSLRFSEVEVRALGTTHALALGRWTLFQPAVSGAEEVTGEGRFTLILNWRDGSWKIVHDHSS